MLNKKNIMRLGIIITSLFSIVTVNAKEKEEIQTQTYLATTMLNIRETPNTDLPPVATVGKNARIQVINFDEQDEWSSILYKDEVKYVHNSYLKEKEEDEASDNIEQQQEQQTTGTYLGSYRITHYCNCSSCCGYWAGGPTASGSMPVAGVTVASGSEFAFGTELIINGHTYTVQDRGVGNGCIDIYCSSHSQAMSNGMYYTDVYLK